MKRTYKLAEPEHFNFEDGTIWHRVARGQAKMKRTYKLAEPEHFNFEDGTTEDRESVTVAPFGKTLSGRTVWADIEDDSMCYLVYDNLLWYYDGQVY